MNRIQNRRKEQDYAITDKITVTLFSDSAAFKAAVEENKDYVVGDNLTRRVQRKCLHFHCQAAEVGLRSSQTQTVKLDWASSAADLKEDEADGEKFAFTTAR